MIVRPADLSKDALAIFEGARDFVRRMDFTGFLPETDADFLEAVAAVVSLPGFETLIAEEEGRVMGLIGFLIAPHIWNPKALTFSELFIWCAPAAPKATFLRLLKAAETRRAERGVRVREYGKLSSSPPGLDRVYKRMGLRKVQESWMGAG